MRLGLFFDCFYWFFTFQFSNYSYNSLTVHGEIQWLVTALLNAFRLECSLPRKKEFKILYFVILISKCHTDYMFVCMCIWTSCFAEGLLYFDNIKVCLGKKNHLFGKMIVIN